MFWFGKGGLAGGACSNLEAVI